MSYIERGLHLAPARAVLDHFRNQWRDTERLAAQRGRGHAAGRELYRCGGCRGIGPNANRDTGLYQRGPLPQQ